MLDAAAPRRTTVEGMSRQAPDAVGAWTGPLPLGFVFLPLALLVVPVVLVLRRVRWLPWTIEARTYPWGRRYPPVVLTYAVRGKEKAARALTQLVEALARGEGAPQIAGTEKLGQSRDAHSRGAVVGTSPSRYFGSTNR
jgi:hypothetical protein